MKPTPEQELICNHPLSENSIVLINAYAGSGKSSTLRLLSEKRPDLFFQYQCFNNTVAKEARESFPKHVDCTTIHSQAYRAVSKIYNRNRLGRELKAIEILKELKLKEPHLALFIRETLNNFLISRDGSIQDHHLKRKLNVELRADILTLTKMLWKRMSDPKGTLPLSHDGYLKIHVASKPLLQHHVILLDEAQDTNPITQLCIEQFMEQGACLVAVGDEHQGIYAFRGAKNYMQTLKSRSGVEHFQLSSSFRLVPEVAGRASDLLNCYKKDPIRIKGLRVNDGNVRTRAFIARTNIALLDRAHNLLLSREAKRIWFAGTSRENNWSPSSTYRFSDIQDVLWISRGNFGKVQNNYLKGFKSYGEIKEYAGVVENKDASGKNPIPRDQELALIVRFIETHGAACDFILNDLASCAVGPEEADITISSAHRSKGLEWDHVELADDFLDLNDDKKVESLLKDDPEAFAQEINLIYVAMTRSRGEIILPGKLVSWFKEVDARRDRGEPLVSGKGLSLRERMLLEARTIKEGC